MTVTHGARVVFRWVAWAFVACVVVQFFFAGLGVFAGAENFEIHRTWGYTFGYLLLVLLAASLLGRMPRGAWAGSLLLMVLFTLQSVFVGLRGSLPWVAALHPVNAVGIFWVGTWLARSAKAWAASDGAAATTLPAVPSREVVR